MMINRESVIKRVVKIEDKLFVSKVLDKIEKCEKIGKLIHTDFLDPHQRELIQNILSEVKGLNYIFSGGFDGAERVLLFFCPDFIYATESNFSEVFEVLCINVKGKENLTHRDFLGSLMGLGIKREKTGDIVIKDGGCHIVVLKEIADFIVYNLEKVGSSKVNIEAVALDEIIVSETDYKEINSTVASLRLDCIGSAGFGISRTKISEYIKNDKVNLNWDPTDDPTKTVKQGDTISLRGKGRIVLEEVGKVTKKGRIGIILKKYI